MQNPENIRIYDDLLHNEERMRNMLIKDCKEVSAGNIELYKSGGDLYINLYEPSDILELNGFTFTYQGCYFNDALVGSNDVREGFSVKTLLGAPFTVNMPQLTSYTVRKI